MWLVTVSMLLCSSLLSLLLKICIRKFVVWEFFNHCFVIPVMELTVFLFCYHFCIIFVVHEFWLKYGYMNTSFSLVMDEPRVWNISRYCCMFLKPKLIQEHQIKINSVSSSKLCSYFCSSIENNLTSKEWNTHVMNKLYLWAYFRNQMINTICTIL